MSTVSQSLQTKELQVTVHLGPFTGLFLGQGLAEVQHTTSPHLSGSKSGLEMPGVSRLKAREEVEKAGDTSREAFEWRLCSRLPQKPAFSCLETQNKRRELSSEGKTERTLKQLLRLP